MHRAPKFMVWSVAAYAGLAHSNPESWIHFATGLVLAAGRLPGRRPSHRQPQHMTSVPTSRCIASGDMTAGRKVAILEVDDANPSDAVIIAVWT